MSCTSSNSFAPNKYFRSGKNMYASRRISSVKDLSLVYGDISSACEYVIKISKFYRKNIFCEDHTQKKIFASYRKLITCSRRINSFVTEGILLSLQLQTGVRFLEHILKKMGSTEIVMSSVRLWPISRPVKHLESWNFEHKSVDVCVSIVRSWILDPWSWSPGFGP
jgi:hypothetical protein